MTVKLYSSDPGFAEVEQWFATLQRRIIEAMEALEREFADAGAEIAPGRFAIEPWERTDASGAPGGGGRMALMRGRLFEKIGAHVSVVHGALPAEFAAQIPGAEKDPRFWAAGVSVIAHPWSPHVPTVHMNTRLVRTTKAWFGGGADLTPMLDQRRKPDDPDAIAFHAAMRGGLRAPSGSRPTPSISGNGATNTFISSIGTSRAGSAASSSIISTAPEMKAIPPSTPISPSCAKSPRASLTSIATSCGATPEGRGARPSARNNWPGADVTSSSTCSMIAAQFSA